MDLVRQATTSAPIELREASQSTGNHFLFQWESGYIETRFERCLRERLMSVLIRRLVLSLRTTLSFVSRQHLTGATDAPILLKQSRM